MKQNAIYQYTCITDICNNINESQMHMLSEKSIYYVIKFIKHS